MRIAAERLFVTLVVVAVIAAPGLGTDALARKLIHSPVIHGHPVELSSRVRSCSQRRSTPWARDRCAQKRSHGCRCGRGYWSRSGVGGLRDRMYCNTTQGFTIGSIGGAATGALATGTTTAVAMNNQRPSSSDTGQPSGGAQAESGEANGADSQSKEQGTQPAGAEPMQLNEPTQADASASGPPFVDANTLPWTQGTLLTLGSGKGEEPYKEEEVADKLKDAVQTLSPRENFRQAQ